MGIDSNGHIYVELEGRIEIVAEVVDEEYRKFGWILDMEGNKIALWEPPV